MGKHVTVVQGGTTELSPVLRALNDLYCTYYSTAEVSRVRIEIEERLRDLMQRWSEYLG